MTRFSWGLTEVNARYAGLVPECGMCTITSRHGVAILLAAFALVAAPAFAQDGGDPLAGRELAARWCVSCHVVDPATQRQGTDFGPSFAAVAAMPSTTAASLAAFLATPHGQMPDYALSRADIANISAYILSLRKH
jgi:mono/diheme cytochrome c family protein